MHLFVCSELGAWEEGSESASAGFWSRRTEIGEVAECGVLLKEKGWTLGGPRQRLNCTFNDCHACSEYERPVRGPVLEGKQ